MKVEIRAVLLRLLRLYRGFESKELDVYKIFEVSGHSRVPLA